MYMKYSGLPYLKYGYTVRVGVLGSEEIDFVCERNGEKMYVQVTLTIQNESTLKREFGNLQKIKDNYPKWVISLDEFRGNSIDGVRHIHLRDFLLEGSSALRGSG